VANMNKDPDTGKSAEDQSDIQLDATLADADEQMLDAIRSRLNLQTGLSDILGSHPRRKFHDSALTPDESKQ